MKRLVIALALLIAGCTAPGADEVTEQVTAAVFLSEGGVMRPLQNGDRVALLEGGWATLTFSVFPPRDGSELEVALQGTAATSISVATEMVGMDHDATTETAVLRDGRYLVPLSFPMPGAYRVLVRVSGAAATSTLTLVIASGG